MYWERFMNPAGESDVTWLYLVRHGATEANERVPPILQGNGIDLALSPEGMRQAEAVASFLKRYPIRRVYTSALKRARQTAATIAAPLGLEPEVDADLQECNVGLWEGLDWRTIEARYPEAHRRFVENPADNPYLGGETYGDVLRRAQPVINRLLAAHAGESIVVVAHNVVNRVLLARLLGLDVRLAPTIAQGNGCVNLICRRAERTELVTLNALFHLARPSDRFRTG
jgi:broad specificity phosphatase PhoE